MQTLDLNLATRPFRNNTLLWTGYGVALLLLALFTWWNVQTYGAQTGKLAELRGKVDGFDRRMTEYKLRDDKALVAIGRYDLDELAVQAAKANDVIEWKAFSWTRLFNQLEELQPYQVKMLAVRPVFYASERKTQHEDVPEGAVPVHVEGIAKDLRQFLAFERALLQDPHFDNVEPEKSNKLDSGEIRFDLKFLYYPGQAPDFAEPDIPQVVDDPLFNQREFKREVERQLAAREAAEGDESAPAEGSGEQGEAADEVTSGDASGEPVQNAADTAATPATPAIEPSPTNRQLSSEVDDAAAAAPPTRREPPSDPALKGSAPLGRRKQTTGGEN
jgi:hypothetical protein